MSQLALDVAVLAMSWASVLAVSNITEEFKRSTARSLIMTTVAVITTLAVMERRGLYRRPALPRTDEISRVFVAVVVGASSVAVAAAFLDWHIGAQEILLGGVVAFGSRILARGVVRALEISGSGARENVVIVGTGYEARELADLVIDHPESHFTLVGVIGNLAVAERSGLDDHWIGPTGRLTELMQQRSATSAIVTATGFRGDQFRAITQELFRAGYDVHLTTGVSRLGEGRFDIRSLSHEPLVVMGRNPVRLSHRWVKRVLDVIGASVALILASPVMIITAALIWLGDRGPITYTARRAGRRGRFFPMYKFRSMVVNADRLKAQMQADNQRAGPLFKMSNDPRITRIGRFIRETSIDELPQLFNVIKGDMSLVGPRPALPEEEEAFDEELRDRFEVRPGITGLWQVEARSNAAFNAYRRLDLHYVENWTLALDLRILLATVEQVVVTLALLPLRALRRGASATDGIAGAPAAAAANGNGHGLVQPEVATNGQLAAALAASPVAASHPGYEPTAPHPAVRAATHHGIGDTGPMPIIHGDPVYGETPAYAGVNGTRVETPGAVPLRGPLPLLDDVMDLSDIDGATEVTSYYSP
jgi:exopolysaccharide biosynthesis polyprenyl glycosylphosphotransferase